MTLLSLRLGRVLSWLRGRQWFLQVSRAKGLTIKFPCMQEIYKDMEDPWDPVDELFAAVFNISTWNARKTVCNLQILASMLLDIQL